MNMQMQKDIEELANKLFKGDMTPIVFDIIKETAYKEECLAYLGKKPQTEEIEQQQIGPKIDFATWFGSFKEVR